MSGIQFTRPTRTRHRQHSFVVSGVAVMISFKGERQGERKNARYVTADGRSVTNCMDSEIGYSNLALENRFFLAHVHLTTPFVSLTRLELKQDHIGVRKL